MKARISNAFASKDAAASPEKDALPVTIPVSVIVGYARRGPSETSHEIESALATNARARSIYEQAVSLEKKRNPSLSGP